MNVVAVHCSLGRLTSSDVLKPGQAFPIASCLVIKYRDCIAVPFTAALWSCFPEFRQNLKWYLQHSDEVLHLQERSAPLKLQDVTADEF